MAPTFAPDRTAFREALAQVAATAQAKLPECNGRIETAVKMVLAGDVTLLPDGTAEVYSQSNGVTTYAVVNGHCDCRDFAQAPHGLCKHRLSAALARRALALVAPVSQLIDSQVGVGQTHCEEAVPVPPPAPAVPLAPPLTVQPTCPEPMFSLTLKGRMDGQDAMLTVRGQTAAEFTTNLHAVRGLLDAPPAAPPEEPHGQDWCAIHHTAMKLNHGKDGRTWLSHRTPQGWCKGGGR